MNICILDVAPRPMIGVFFFFCCDGNTFYYSNIAMKLQIGSMLNAIFIKLKKKKQK